MTQRDTIRVDERDPNSPLCPHCGEEIDELSARKVESTLGVRYVYYCPRCRKVLGISQRKGFWMG